jgi:hypothetical protein
MSKNHFKSPSSQESLDTAVQNIQQVLGEIHGVIESLQASTNAENSAEILPETLQEVQEVLDKVVTEFQLLDQQLIAVLAKDSHESKLLNWFNHGERLKTSA